MTRLCCWLAALGVLALSSAACEEATPVAEGALAPSPELTKRAVLTLLPGLQFGSEPAQHTYREIRAVEIAGAHFVPAAGRWVVHYCVEYSSVASDAPARRCDLGVEVDPGDDVWQGIWTVPEGGWEYKAALNGGWGENYGANAQPKGANIPLNLAAEASVKFYYDHKTHWVTSNLNSVIATVPGSFQSALGCPGDWQPDCLRSWLQDPDGDGTYSFKTTSLPAGNYEGKVAIDESWAENYGQGGVQNGANIPFTVNAPDDNVVFSYNSTSHVLTITVSQGELEGSEKVPQGVRLLCGFR